VFEAVHAAAPPIIHLKASHVQLQAGLLMQPKNKQ